LRRSPEGTLRPSRGKRIGHGQHSVLRTEYSVRSTECLPGSTATNFDAVPRRGVTLVELLVVLLVIGVLVALLIPMIQRARESARSNTCRNNLKQFGIALSNYHDAHDVLPPAHISETAWGWHMMVQPYIDASPLYNQLNPSGPMALVGPEFKERLKLVRTVQPIALCPSDSAETPATNEPTSVETNVVGTRTAIGLSVYLGIIGDIDAACPAGEGNGTMFHNSSVSFDDITDGRTHTLLVGERDRANHVGGNWAGTSYDVNDPAGCKDPHFVAGFCNERRPINGKDPFSFGSLHDGGAHFAMADGSVQFISESIDAKVYRQFANRKDMPVKPGRE
jgi:prepilin-type N-terminal cleavage/methylation domain-containing protein/prepilin-type processing-associated H-X9-DG protein